MSLQDDIKLLRINYLRGPNIWTYRAVLEVWLDLGKLEDFPSNLLPGFNDRLVALLPALVEHHCGVGERGGFIQRLLEGTWSGHVLEHVVIELLNLSDMPTGFGQTRSTTKRGVYRMVFRARDEQVARTALAEGHRLLMAAINGTPYGPADVQASVEKIRAKIDDCYLGPSTASIVAAATDRRIPHIRLNDGNLVQLGYGASQRRIWTAETDLTSAIAEGIAHDKDLTKSLLVTCGVPVPEGEIVNTVEEAWEAAEDIGLPVVVKPSDGNHGRGVSLDLNTREEVQAAFEMAARHGSEVMVERFVRGHEHRLLVVGGKVVAAARGETACVTGDGVSTVTQLVDAQLNTDPRRGDGEDFPLGRIETAEDGAVVLDLQRQGLSPDAVPAAGREVLIQRNGNVAIDCTDEVHPEVDHIVSLAARVVGLDIAGVDVVAQDISRPLHEQGGAIVEVNAGPGLLMHLKPAEGSPRPVGRAICDHLFPNTAHTGDADHPHDGRIPIVGIAGSAGNERVARLVAWLLHLSGRHTGLACQAGLFLDQRCVDAADCTTWEAGQRLLINRAVQAAVFQSGAETILRTGLPYDKCQVGVVTDLGGTAGLAEFDITEDDQMYKVMRSQVDVVLPGGAAVLNAGDARIVEMEALCDGEVIFYSTNPKTSAIAAHCAKGGRALYIRQNQVVLATGASEAFLPGLGKLAAWRERRGLSEDALLAAVGAAWALGIPLNLIGAGMEAFETTPKNAGSAE
ncbi:MULTISPECIES: cyanophycin synthetase [unclassified Polaromonas]|uniref:cyanophycin synthetase n=1 Tax=unclassified Polaromonas TaxID=2638319 RepID=UPI000F088E4F|nr:MULTISPECIES: cyanophycin synthetase [unclassified Polaromonas]AYQ26807.1 cyanophycin synthetase [Polaromonas sp. SP1]QGJ18349.1 cyanophycin synthetase [Polaromonas sp. Pch-P]